MTRLAGVHPALRAALAAALGALATLAFAPFDWWPLWPAALAAALFLAGDRPRRAALVGLCFGVGQFAAGLYWVVISTHVHGGAPLWLGLALWWLLAAYLALYPAIVFGLGARLGLTCGTVAGVIGLAALWTLAELLRGMLFTGFGWLAAGYALLGTPLDRLAAVLGVHGLTAVMALWAAGLHAAARQPRTLLVALLPLAAALLPAPSSWTRPAADALDAVVIQGSVPQHEKWRPEQRLPTWQRYRDLTLAALPADLIVWPEVALTVPLEDAGPRWLAPLGARLAREGATALVGISRHEGDLPYNSAVAIGAAQGIYDKRHLVPFGEYFPVPDWVRPIMAQLGTPYGDIGFGAPVQPRIRVRGVPLAISICFEDVFGHEIARDARDAGLLVNLTNDAWFGDSTAPHQHFQIARMRAVETGRELLRAANTGISAHVDADGRVLARTPQFRPATLRARAVPREGMTPYMRWRDAPLWLLALLGFVAGGVLMRRRGLRPAPPPAGRR